MKSKTAKVIMALLICPIVMLVLSMMLPKRYTASMSLMLDPSLKIVPAADPQAALVDTLNGPRAHTIETEIDKLTGSEVLLGAIQLTADQHPKAFNTQLAAETKYTSLVNRLRIDNNRNSDIVNLSVTMDDPAIAADTANNIAKSYMAFNDKMSAASGSGVLMNVNKQIEDKEQELNDLDSKIAAIKTKYGLSDAAAAGQISDKARTDMRFNLANTQAQYDGAVGELNAAESTLQTTPKYIASSTGTTLNPAAVDLDQKISQTASDLEASRAKYTDDYPLVKQYVEKLNNLRAERAKTPDSVISQRQTSLNPNYTAAQGAVAAAKSKVNSLSGSVSQLQSQLAKMESDSKAYPQAEKELSNLQMKKLTTQQQYQMLVSTKSGIDTSGGSSRKALATVVSFAMPPGTPSFPNPKVFVLMGLAIGIIISALIVMPKAPDIMYVPTAADSLALDNTSMRAAALPTTVTPEPEPARPAIEPGKPS